MNYICITNKKIISTMKKIVLGFTFVLSLFFTESCNRDNDLNSDVQNSALTKNVSKDGLSAKNDNLTEDELVLKLSADQDFIDYGNSLLSFFNDMPTKANFRANFDPGKFGEGKESYFLQLSGYSSTQVEDRVIKLDNLLRTLTTRYPQLNYDGKNQAFIQSVIEKADAIVEANLAISGKRNPACQACVDKWKPRMITATVFGALAGGLFGGGHPYAIWAGAVGGFAGAGWGAVDCLEAAGC